ncbi:glycoside hydrolase family 15 protein [Methyloligella sp. 2.7D]|uniref:glycoside hydrolase family 15 protein n=1 Tax=unclassified Methyloligella TaxID=2625955 RepID=UPI00157CA443|nr:glycoside hydrolase family 15 protein [Methyloligella sp. GL2]QKP76882.1 glycoside hydrolase family 15 protein [Methyloligella sp. GL2]
MSLRIEDYALIGNTISSALVSREGSIDWLCLPRFDSPACFARLMGDEENGFWKIAPKDKATVTRRYLPDTAVLETRFETKTGVVTLTDFMPLTDDPEKVAVNRIVSGVSGKVEMTMELVLRFGYGQAVPWVQQRDYGLHAVAGPDAVELHTHVPLEGKNMRTLSHFTVREGESVPMTLSYHPTYKRPSFVPDRHETLTHTVAWWENWVKHGRFEHIKERWRGAVKRSLITLKLLTYEPTGGIVAAPTTSLPETLGGSRNWDYRFTWVRDSSLTLYALLNGGYREEATAWRKWLLRATAGDPQQLQIMYGIAGERSLPEYELPWLPGYDKSAPVRVGNAAANQTQLDVFGELMDMLYGARCALLPPEHEAWEMEKVLLQHLQSNWQNLGRGIWEVRGEPRAFTHSRMMCWVAFDRAVESAERFKLEGPVASWRETRDAIHKEICEKGFDSGLNSFTQYYGGKTLDAALLLMPQVGFLPPEDPRVVGTIAAIEKELIRDGLVLRYSTSNTDDGVGGREGAFLACSYWLADAYALCNRTKDAEALFDRLLDLRNDLGLLSEEYDQVAKRLVGNFPQAFSHLGLINSAFNLCEVGGPAQQRAGKDGPPANGANRP